MLLAIVVLYWPPPMAPGEQQFASDYLSLHVRRMSVAREALLGPAHALPGWYSREFLGTPFWANVQNFPFLPTRLAVLLLLDPRGPHTFAIAATLAALVAASFTFLYCRRIGLGAVGSATAGWTFVASGFYASRIAAGHLPLLEAYAALPLLLWAVESLVQSPASVARRLLVLGLSTTCVLLVGHPQLSVYALMAAGAYVIWRSASLGRGLVARVAPPLIAMALGAACAAFALVPMALLTARSTRTLALDSPGNDLALPYGRLVAWLFPWIDGWPEMIATDRASPFIGYGSPAYFWDTVNYIGWLPWIAAVAMCFFVARRPAGGRYRPTTFLIVMSLLAVALALPWWQDVTRHIPGTYLRSPARLTYLAAMGLAVALGLAVDRALRASPKPGVRWAVALALAAHAIDLGAHDRRFIFAFPFPDPIDSPTFDALARAAGDGRVSIDYHVISAANRRLDDVGVFDSVLLARTYRFLLDVSGAPPGANVQDLIGEQFSARSLAMAGVTTVLSVEPRRDLPQLPRVGPLFASYVPRPAARAAFFASRDVRFMDRAAIHTVLTDQKSDLRSTIMLPPDAQPEAPPAVEGAGPATVTYSRDSSDRIRCTVDAPAGGFLRVIESFDPGWSATLDSAAAPIYPAQDALLAVAVPAGRHEVVFSYHTPGRVEGLGISLGSFIVLVGGSWLVGARARRQA